MLPLSFSASAPLAPVPASIPQQASKKRSRESVADDIQAVLKSQKPTEATVEYYDEPGGSYDEPEAGQALGMRPSDALVRRMCCS